MPPVTKPAHERYDIVFIGGGSGGVAGSVSRYCFVFCFLWVWDKGYSLIIIYPSFHPSIHLSVHHVACLPFLPDSRFAGWGFPTFPRRDNISYHATVVGFSMNSVGPQVTERKLRWLKLRTIWVGLVWTSVRWFFSLESFMIFSCHRRLFSIFFWNFQLLSSVCCLSWIYGGLGSGHSRNLCLVRSDSVPGGRWRTFVWFFESMLGGRVETRLPTCDIGHLGRPTSPLFLFMPVSSVSILSISSSNLNGQYWFFLVFSFGTGCVPKKVWCFHPSTRACSTQIPNLPMSLISFSTHPPLLLFRSCGTQQTSPKTCATRPIMNLSETTPPRSPGKPSNRDETHTFVDWTVSTNGTSKRTE